jgi:dihydroneopterin aldolase
MPQGPHQSSDGTATERRLGTGDGMDRIVLRGIRCMPRIGVTAEERRRPQDCRVDVEIEVDLAAAARSDDLRDTLDYAAVFAAVVDLARGEEFALLERFAGRLEEELRRFIPTGAVLIRVEKLRPPLPGALDSAGVEIRRS